MEQKHWKRNLYEKSDYPDNYTDSTFLQDLRKNIHKQDVTYRDAVLGAGRITERLCIVAIFCVIFAYLYNEWMEPQTVFVQSSIAVCLCYIKYITTQCSQPAHVVIGKDSKTVMIFIVFGYVLSPVLKTLTDTISTDTIYAAATVMMLVHLVFCDYQVPAGIVASSFSLNAAIFGSVCLASRLSTPFHAFVLLTISAELFVLYPFFIQMIFKSTIPFLSCIILFTFILLSSTSFIISILFLLVSMSINVICPFLFVYWQKDKENIYGPWDEAVVKDNDF